jgi:hypothetical protein
MLGCHAYRCVAALLRMHWDRADRLTPKAEMSVVGQPVAESLLARWRGPVPRWLLNAETATEGLAEEFA